MKSICLVLDNIYFFANKSKYFFLTLIISISVSVFAMLYFFGYSLNLYYENSQYYQEKNSLQFNISEQKKENIIELINDLCSNDMELINKIYISDLDGLDINSNIYDNKVKIIGEYFNNIKQKDNVCIINVMYMYKTNNTYGVGDEIKLNNVKYKVIGLREYSPYDDVIAIPFKSYIENDFPVKQIKIIYNQKPSKEQISQIKNILANKKTSSVILPTSFEWKAFKDTIFIIILFVFLFIFCLINIFLIINCWIINNMKTYNIYTICGGHKSHIMLIQFISNMFLTIVSYFIGSILYIIILDGKYFTLKSYLKTTNYIFVFIALFLISSFLSLVNTIRFYKKNDLYKI